jgi:hypothetical protein
MIIIMIVIILHRLLTLDSSDDSGSDIEDEDMRLKATF